MFRVPDVGVRDFIEFADYGIFSSLREKAKDVVSGHPERFPLVAVECLYDNRVISRIVMIGVCLA